MTRLILILIPIGCNVCVALEIKKMWQTQAAQSSFFFSPFAKLASFLTATAVAYLHTPSPPPPLLTFVEPSLSVCLFVSVCVLDCSSAVCQLYGHLLFIFYLYYLHLYTCCCCQSRVLFFFVFWFLFLKCQSWFSAFLRLSLYLPVAQCVS